MKQIKSKAVEFAANALIIHKQVWIDLDDSITFGPNNHAQNQYVQNVKVFLRHRCAADLYEELKTDPEMQQVIMMELLKTSPQSIMGRIGNLISSCSVEIMALAREKVRVIGVENFPKRRPSKRDLKRQRFNNTTEAALQFSNKLSPELQQEFQNIINEFNSFIKPF